MTDKEKQELQANEKLANEEYKIWKKHAPFIYDTLITRALEWPSLSVQWLPDSQTAKYYTTWKLLLGTHTTKGDFESIQIAKVDIPNAEFSSASASSNEPSKKLVNKIDIVQKIDHDKEPNVSRYCPKNPNLIGTMSTSGDALIFDRTLFPERSPSRLCTPQYRLKHHTREGYALAWNPFNATQLVTGAEDCTVALWDLQNYNPANNVGFGEFKPTIVRPHTVLKESHSAIVNTVKWSYDSSHLFASGADDKSLLIHDTRHCANRKSVLANADSHPDGVTSIDFNPRPGFKHTLVSGCADGSVRVWDLRRFNMPVTTIAAHASSISCIEWSPHNGSVFASGSHDRRIHVWDLSRTDYSGGNEGDGIVNDDDFDDSEGPRTLAFIHGGHLNRISDLSWHPVLPWTLASVSEDNIVMVWSVAASIMDTRQPREEEEELELDKEREKEQSDQDKTDV